MVSGLTWTGSGTWTVKGHQYHRLHSICCMCFAGLGWNGNIPKDELKAAKVLHWSGKGERDWGCGQHID